MWERFNPNHEPAGSPTGGQFAPADGGTGTTEKPPSNPYISTGSDEYGVTNNEYAKIQSWLGTGYRSLRTDPEFGKILEKLPLFNGKVYRGALLRPEDMAKLKVGSVYTIGKYSSSSLREDIAADFASGSMNVDAPVAAAREHVIMEVYDRGRKIPKEYAEAAGTATEHEVVLMTGDQYKISSIAKETNEAGKTYTRVVMRHV